MKKKITEIGYRAEIKSKTVRKLNSGDIFTIDIYKFMNEQNTILKNAHILPREQAIEEMGISFLEIQPYNCITLKMK